MSLYESTGSSIKFDINNFVKSRPKWLNNVLAIATGYTLICLLLGIANNYQERTEFDRYITRAKEINEPLRRYPDAFSQLNQIVERSETDFKERQTSKFIAQAINFTLVVATIVYFFKGIKILGFYVAGLWAISSLVIVARIFEIDVGFLEQMYFVITFGWNRSVGLTLILLQTLFFMWLYFYSAKKFSRNNNGKEVD